MSISASARIQSTVGVMSRRIAGSANCGGASPECDLLLPAQSQLSRRRIMNIRPLTLATLGALCMSCAVLATATEKAPAPDSITSSSFVNDAAQTGLAEVELGKVALQKSQDPQVRSFAERMVKDHGKANEELGTLAKGKNVQVPAQLDAKHRSMVDMLKAQSGAAFEADYAKHMAEGHAKAVALFESASKSKSLDHELAAFAQKTLPTLEEHKRLADQLSATRTAEAPEKAPRPY
jgi:putative membrane protein